MDDRIESTEAELASAETDLVTEDAAPIVAVDGLAPSARRRPLRFDRLQIDGFKSFADRAEIPIEPGITGVVGPNGCGKSNLLESLRWALGETSARRMRGEGMDDVIFAGSERRSARSVAEVVIVLDNRRRTATPEFNDADILEVSRRIDRGQGTSYRVNGRPARQRDVQVLFQDNAAGASSPAIVSQGRVNKLIQDKPADRRIVLEEAAGVSGLSSRRHEADLKVRQTEQNLLRADDAIAQSGEVVAVLRRQARQVARRREIDGRVKEAQAGVMQLKRLDAVEAEAKARDLHASGDKMVEEAILAVRATERQRDEAMALLVPARQARTDQETAHARAAARLEGIEAEAQRMVQELQEAQRRVVEIAGDRKRGDDDIAQAKAAIGEMSREREALAAESADAPDALERGAAATEAAEEQARFVEAEVSSLAADFASRQATRAAAQRQRDEAMRRLEAVERRLSDTETRLAQLRQSQGPGDHLAEASAAAEIATEAFARSEELLAAAEERLALARQAEEGSLEALRSLSTSQSRAEAELAGLAAVREQGVSANPIAGRLIVPPGLEAAIAAALGDGMAAGTDPAEEIWWVETEHDDDGLAAAVDGAVEVKAALSRTILCATDAEVFDRADKGVDFGVVLVSPTGAFARWDGLRGRQRAQAAGEALKRAARIRELRMLIDQAAGDLERLRLGSEAAKADLLQARRADEDARRASRQAFDTLRRARDELAAREKAGEEIRHKLALLENEVSLLRVEKGEANTGLLSASQALAELSAEDEAARKLDEARRRLDAARREEQSSRSQFERLRSQIALNDQRFRTLLAQEADWHRRLKDAEGRRAELNHRAEEAERVLSEAAQRPASPAEVVEAARDEVRRCRTQLDAAARALDEVERAREAVEMKLRTDEAALATLRENRARSLALIEQAVTNLRNVEDQIREKLLVEPGDLDTIAPCPDRPPEMAPAIQAAEQRLVRLERERESLGAVNFLAEEELAEQEKKLGEIEAARNELRETIVKLRKIIHDLETEARIKLQEAFRLIDGHFGELFVRLFGGGEAHLRLVGSEDILHAGLEIFASPPGKRLQVLSLLSGGEQALTAMALVFAAFLSNPAPICVLDEVDAPLDDANTDRLCRLIEQMAANDATRFLVVTHKPLTMARMNRLFGVTMAERGVSSVTRVDLDKAIEFAGD